MKRKIISVVSLLLLFSVLFSVTAFAGTAYDSYTYWEDISASGRKAVKNRPMYSVNGVIDAKTIGVKPFSKLKDITTDRNNHCYILDEKSRIVIVDEKFRLIGEIDQIKGSETADFEDASGLYVHSDNTIFLCDTEHKRVVRMDQSGTCLDEYFLPESPLIPESFDYKPVKAVMNSKGFLYVLSDGSYYGALLYSPDKEFVGFYGANTVTNNIFGAVKSLFNRMFPNNEKSSRRASSLPFCFSDIVIDQNDFIYTATDSANDGQIKKLNPGEGKNILDSEKVRFIDDNVNRTLRIGKALLQSITGLDIIEDQFLCCLDSTYGRVFLYDSDCKMLNAFGGGMGQGVRQGTFTNACAVSARGRDILVADSTNNSVTVFSCNEYGNRVLDLAKLTHEGNYTEAKAGWEEVLRSDKNLQIAYQGLARAYLTENDYAGAMKIAKQGYDRDTYAIAFKYYRNDFISRHFTVLFIGAVVIIAAIITAIILLSRRKTSRIRNEKVGLMLKTLIHPGQSFEEISEKKKGSVGLSVLLLVLFYITSVLSTIWGGFLFTKYDADSFNALWVLLRSVGLVALWVVSDWMVCTLSNGKGRLSEIFIVTSYALMPIILKRVIWIVLSNVLLPDESAFLSILTAVAVLYSFILLCIGMMRIHEYNMGKFILTSVFAVILMAAVALLMFLVFILIQQFGGFLVTLFSELMM